MSQKTTREKGNFIYRAGHILCRFAFFAVRRAKAEGLQNIPADGAFIVAPNHAGLIDPPLVGASCPFALNYMAKEELFRVPVLGWLLSRTNVFPVDRGSSDVRAAKNAAAILESGKPLLIFPEGTRGKNNFVKKKPKLGAGYFAAKTGVPVVPVRLINTDSFFSGRDIKVIWGKPVEPPPENAGKEELADWTARLLEKIYSLESGKAS